MMIGHTNRIKMVIMIKISIFAAKDIDFMAFLVYILSVFTFSKRLIYTFSNKITRNKSEGLSNELLIADLSRPKKTPFDIKTESSYNAYLSKTQGSHGLALDLKKPNCIVWLETPNLEYEDHVIEAKIQLDSLGGYASAGLLFHIMDSGSYYIALVSSKGYFRLDLVKDGAPKPLIAWTEIADFDGTNIALNIITYGSYLIFVVNGKWLGEASDDSISAGKLGFALASYEATASYETASGEISAGEAADKTASGTDVICKARLDYFSVDARIKTIEDSYKKWSDDANINAESRLRLAETFAVMGKSAKALEQINRAWKRRDEAIRSVAGDYTEVRTRKELLLAARMSFRLGQFNEADEFASAILDQLTNDPARIAASVEGKEALSEKIKALNEQNKFAELKNFILKYNKILNKNINLYTTLARCYWELKEYNDAAITWEKVYKLSKENGVYAVNAANALELAGKTDEAFAYYLDAGKLFLKQDNMPELAALVPKLLALGEKNWEAHTLAGKWAFSIEDYDKCELEFSEANKLRCAVKPRPKADPAIYYLWGLVLNIRGKNSSAIRMLERAVRLAPDYGLFRFKLAEIKLTSGKKDPKTTDQKLARQQLVEELKLALKLVGSDPGGKLANHAGTLLQKAGDSKNAKYFFEKARKKQG